MHIYHYDHYEPTALKRLMARYGTREDEVDELLRREVFVDLYARRPAGDAGRRGELLAQGGRGLYPLERDAE